jgi:hypothetical protein
MKLNTYYTDFKTLSILTIKPAKTQMKMRGKERDEPKQREGEEVA